MTERVNATIENALWDYATKLAGSNPNVKDARRYLLAALEAEGLVVVPVESTPAMNSAGYMVLLSEGKREVGRMWKAMIAAAKEDSHDG